MKILVLNPNSSEAVTGAIMESARRAAGPATELIGVTTKGGTRNIDSAFGDYLSGAFMLRTGLEAVEVHGPDAVVLAGFGRVGVDALKEAMTIPVVSIAEASMAVACLLGHRFTTLTMLQQFIPYQQDLVRLYGFEAKCASVRAININVEECAIERERTLAELKAQIFDLGGPHPNTRIGLVFCIEKSSRKTILEAKYEQAWSRIRSDEKIGVIGSPEVSNLRHPD